MSDESMKVRGRYLEQMVESAHRQGIKINGMFIIGSDADGKDVVKKTRAFFKRIRMDTATFAILYPIPKIVFLPVIILLLGIGNLSKVFVIALILFFQILLVVRDEAAKLRPELIASVRSLGAGRRAIFRFVYLPACLPAVLTSLRVSIGTAIAVLFFAESFATTSGLGYYIIVETWGRLAYPEMYAGVIAMSLLGLSLYIIVNRLERALCPWLFV